MMKKLLKVTNAAGADHISWTKVGVVVCAVVGAVVGAGVCPPAALPIAKIILAVGAGVGLIGARDAIQK